MTLQLPGAPAAIGVRSSFRNLKGSRTSNSVVRIQIDEIVMLDANNNPKFFTSFDVSPDITVSGAGGLDSGAEAANTWYYIWAIGKADGTKSAILSTSSSAPTMPSGYDFKALVSAVRNDGSSNFINFNQYGREYFYAAWQSLASGSPGSGSWTSISTAALVPNALSTHAFGSFFGGSHTAMANDSAASTTITTGDRNKYIANGNALDEIRWDFDIITADTLYWQAGASGTVYLHGFTLNKLV